MNNKKLALLKELLKLYRDKLILGDLNIQNIHTSGTMRTKIKYDFFVLYTPNSYEKRTIKVRFVIPQSLNMDMEISIITQFLRIKDALKKRKIKFTAYSTKNSSSMSCLYIINHTDDIDYQLIVSLMGALLPKEING